MRLRSGSIPDVLVVGLAAIGLRAAAQILLGFYMAPEAWEYDILARNVVAGSGYVIDHNGTLHRAFTLPLYSLMLAATYLVAGPSPIGVGILQVTLGGMLAALTYVLARPLGRSIALTSGIAVASHPGLVFYATQIHALNLDAVIATGSALLARIAWVRPDLRTAIGCGLASGLAALERITFVPVLGLALAASAWRARVGVRTLPLMLVWLALTMLLVAPWVARNAVVLGTPLLSTTGNEALWLGNNPQATGSNLSTDGRRMLDAVPEIRDRIWGRPDVVQDETFRRVALAHMSADVPGTLARTAVKLGIFWWSGPQTGAHYPGAWTNVYTAYYVAVLVLAVIGIRRVIRDRPEILAATVITAVPVSLLQAIYYVEGRHRWAIEPLLLVLAATGLAVLLARYRRVSRDGRRISAEVPGPPSGSTP